MRNCNVDSGNNSSDSCRLPSLVNKSESVQNGGPMTSLKCLIINPVQSVGRTYYIELQPYYQSHDSVTLRKEKLQQSFALTDVTTWRAAKCQIRLWN
jgi:hypothetical protein